LDEDEEEDEEEDEDEGLIDLLDRFSKSELMISYWLVPLFCPLPETECSAFTPDLLGFI
jgi:hypothetical protein